MTVSKGFWETMKIMDGKSMANSKTFLPVNIDDGVRFDERFEE